MAAFMRSCQPRLGWAGHEAHTAAGTGSGCGDLGAAAARSPLHDQCVHALLMSAESSASIRHTTIRYGHMTAHCPQPTP